MGSNQSVCTIKGSATARHRGPMAAAVAILCVCLALKDSHLQDSREHTGDLPAPHALDPGSHAAAIIMTAETNTDYIRRTQDGRSANIHLNQSLPQRSAPSMHLTCCRPHIAWENHYTPEEDAATADLDAQAQTLAAQQRIAPGRLSHDGFASPRSCSCANVIRAHGPG